MEAPPDNLSEPVQRSPPITSPQPSGIYSQCCAGGYYIPPRIRSLNGRNSPSWGDCSLSADLTADEIPATGGHRRFVPPHGFSSRTFGAPGRKNRKVEKFLSVVFASFRNFSSSHRACRRCGFQSRGVPLDNPPLKPFLERFFGESWAMLRFQWDLPYWFVSFLYTAAAAEGTSTRHRAASSSMVATI